MKWSLATLLDGLHRDVQQRLEISRQAFGHPVAKGDASEEAWLKMLQEYLPKRYQAETAHVVDSNGEFSDQIDIVVFDRQYSPFIFNYQKQLIVPAESVYAVFEAKQSINAEQIEYAQKKIASVRRLHRTSLPIPHAGGVYPAKPLIPILGGLLTFESDWNPPLGQSLISALEKSPAEEALNLGCVAAHGHFQLVGETSTHIVTAGERPATAFLFNLISMLQFSGTVPMIDIKAYAKWLAH
ncbi:DUF6602 domain-containing protein [Sinorhizobium sp. BJ1]|uniref:DUF6602 domain-containing protein n=1 Tax=Sinorhizobium sp. BJ1 TaxID=2035455 RepID=UPI000BE7B4D1|nr:DUF6602 domain-containing protein [Sinorhizobium sp. BJ1]PDT80857.1 hypothetical protein CO676_25375 [Sinorhizobium sp. BJ1]